MQEIIGTRGLLTRLQQHWNNPIHPVYQFESRFSSPWSIAHLDHYLEQGGKVLVSVAGAALFFTIARVATDWPIFWGLSNGFIVLVSVLFIGVLGLIEFSFTFLWPLAVAVTASSAIVRERERRTWSALLVTPLTRQELVTVKLASAMRWLKGPIRVVVWIQGIFLAITMILVVLQIGQSWPGLSPLVGFCITILAGIQFGTERLQDGAAACLIGLIGSLVGETRQVSFLVALFGGAGLIVLRVLLTGLLLLFLTVPSPQAALLLLATGPTAAIALALPPPLAILALLGLIVGREWLIRRGYRWALAHLHDPIGD